MPQARGFSAQEEMDVESEASGGRGRLAALIRLDPCHRDDTVGGARERAAEDEFEVARLVAPECEARQIVALHPDSRADRGRKARAALERSGQRSETHARQGPYAFAQFSRCPGHRRPTIPPPDGYIPRQRATGPCPPPRRSSMIRQSLPTAGGGNVR